MLGVFLSKINGTSEAAADPTKKRTIKQRQSSPVDMFSQI
jgi:hypothetical protein